MFPTISIGSIALPTYPLFMLLAFWAGLWVAAYQAKRLGFDSDHIYNAGLYGLLAGLVGARLWFVVTHWENYRAGLSQLFSLSRSALSAGGGLMVAILVVLIYLQRNRTPGRIFLDAVTPGLALALVVVNVGAFLGGEALGATANLPWAIEIAGTARHPVQLYEAITNLIILAILYFKSYHPWPGFQFWLWLALYSAGRLLLEVFRAQPDLTAGGYLTVQIVALATMVVALVVMGYHFNQNSTETNPKRL
jgi:phosphatidylglycerol:prolipoprotein diacylglycerol transferase